MLYIYILHCCFICKHLAK